MTAALLSYASNPAQVAISASGATSEVGITFLVANKGSTSVSIDQIVLTIPQGDGGTDLIAPETTFTTGSVHSSNVSSWSLSAAANQVTLAPVSAQGYATLTPGDSLQFTLTGLHVNASGAGKTADIAVVESIYNGGNGSALISIRKIAPGFYIETFFLDQYNVAPGSPVTVTWKVVDALSCSVTAGIVQVAPVVAERNGIVCGVGTANPVCDGTISSGTDFSGSHTCIVQGATVFTLIASRKGSSGDVTLSSQLLVTVNEPAINFTGFPPTPSMGQEVTLKWLAADAGLLQLYVAPTPGQPSRFDLTATPAGSKTFQPLVDTKYYLYAFANSGDTQPAKQSEFDVSVEQPQWSGNLAASSVSTPIFPGDLVTLNWNVLNVDHCELTCDAPGYAPIHDLPADGSHQVTMLDPGVANATATFTLTPVQYGGLGNFTPTATTVAITNQPYFSQNLTASPATMAASGGSCTLTWALDHADTAVLTTNLPGVPPLTVDPSAGQQVVQIPAIVIPTPIVYTLTASRQNQKYVSTSTVQVQCIGDASVLWCIAPQASGTSSDYLNSLYLQHPNQRIRKVQLNLNDGYGVFDILVWYSDSADADYSLTGDYFTSSSSLIIPDGDHIDSLSAWYYMLDQDDGNYPTLWAIKLTTAGGLSVAIGTPDGDSNDGPFTVSVADDSQAIAFVWYAGGIGLGDIGLVSCSKDYGQ